MYLTNNFFNEFFNDNGHTHALYKEDDKYVATFDLPGVKKEDIKTNIENRILSIKAERKKGDNVIKTYNEKYRLPVSISTEYIEGKYEDGVLSLTFKKDEEQKQSINIL